MARLTKKEAESIGEKYNLALTDLKSWVGGSTYRTSGGRKKKIGIQFTLFDEEYRKHDFILLYGNMKDYSLDRVEKIVKKALVFFRENRNPASRYYQVLGEDELSLLRKDEAYFNSEFYKLIREL